MKFSEMLKYKYEQYIYQRRRDISRYKKRNNQNSIVEAIVDLVDDADELDEYIAEMIEEIEDIAQDALDYIPRRRR